LPAALGANTTYYVAVSNGAFKDGNNNFFAGISTANFGIGINLWEFTTVDQTAPTLTAITPANTAVGVASNFKINLTFSEPIEVGTGIISIHTTLGASTGLTQVNVQSPSVTRVTGTDNQIVIDPGVNFAYGTIISLEIPNTAFKDKAPVANNYAGITGVGTHSFTVGANPVPSIMAFSPLDNSNSAPLTEPFRITFSEPMKLSTTPGRINIWDNTGAAVSVQTIDLATDSHMLTWEQDGKVAVIAHLPLVMNKTYEVIVDANTFVDKETGTQVFAQAISDVANYP
jgi:methionine-rich copper-binding protein CopC